MDGSSDDPSISELVIARLASGILWILEAEPVWKGPGLHKPCIVCGERIDGHEIQYDVPGPRGALPAHATCYRVWSAISFRMRNNPPI